jgi:hypothetical protein
MNVGEILGKFGSKGEENMPIVSLKLSIIQCVREIYNQGFML